MNNIYNKIDDMFDDFEQSKLYKDYILAKEKLRNNKEIMDIIEEIKRLQKIVTNNNDEVVEQKLKKLFDKLNSYPIYQSYLILKDEINDELFLAKESFDKYFNEILKI